MVLACLALFPEAVRAQNQRRTPASEDLTRPSFKTLTVGSCPGERGERRDAEWSKKWEEHRNCSRARLMYPHYRRTPWMNRLIAQSIILPMFAERLDEKPANGGGEALYKGKLMSLVQKGGARGSVERPPPIDFAARLVGHEASSLSPAGVPRPELFGHYLQFVLSHELSQRYDTRPEGQVSSFVVIDTRARKVLTFDDLILPGKEGTLENLQLAAFRDWLRAERKLPNMAIRAHLANPSYAFRLNRNWRIGEGGLVFRFGVLEVGPLSFGAMEILVEKERLHDVVRPDILEQIPGRGELTAGD